MKRYLYIAAVMSAWAACVPLAGPAAAAGPVGKPAPAFTARELDGQTFDVAALKGKVVVINYWATWCTPCRKEMPAFDAFYGQHHNEGLEMIGVSIERGRARGDVRKAAQSVAYPVAMVGDIKPDGFRTPDTIPVTYVIDREGIVRAYFGGDRGPLTAADLDKTLLPLLAEGAANQQTP